MRRMAATLAMIFCAGAALTAARFAGAGQASKAGPAQFTIGGDVTTPLTVSAAPHEKRPARWIQMMKSLTLVKLPGGRQ
jgi:hypothetical protein